MGRWFNEDAMKSKIEKMLSLSVWLAGGWIIGCLLTAIAAAQIPQSEVDGPSTFQDPAVPLLSLPAEFRSKRVNRDRPIPESGHAVLANLQGPGCVRHIWLLPGDDVRLVIHVDGASEPQVDVPLKPFFGVMHDLKPYFIDCAAYCVLPNPAKGIPGTPGYNLFLPIPFAKSCLISLVGSPGQRAVAMTDWQQYDESTRLTSYRLHAQHHRYSPAPERGKYVELADVTGRGFLAGVAVGYMQQNHTDMVFHTGGMTMLIDGETDPHVIRGHNVEDDFGFTWGFNDRQTRWIGCPWHVNRGRNDQDGVFYRFFGPDPIRFESSLLFRTGCRGDDMESMVYYYRRADSPPPQETIVNQWQIIGPFPGGDQWDTFQKNELPGILHGDWSGDLPEIAPELMRHDLESQRGWIDLQHVFFHRHHTATPLTVLNHSAYLGTTLEREKAGRAILRLALDDWAQVWVNGQELATLKHEQGMRICRIPVELNAGANRLVIKTNNTDQPLNKRTWAIQMALEDETVVADSDGNQ